MVQNDIENFDSNLSQSIQYDKDCSGLKKWWKQESTKKKIRELRNGILKLIKIGLNFFDIISDYILVVNYYLKEDYLYGSLTLFFVVVPMVYIVCKRKAW